MRNGVLLIDGAPSPEIGVPGQYARDRQTRALWKKEQGDLLGPAMWVQVAAPQILKGDKGDPGDPGSPGGGPPQPLAMADSPRFAGLGINVGALQSMLEVAGHETTYTAAALISRTVTATSGTINGLQVSFVPRPTANSSATYSGFANGTTTNANDSTNLTGVLIASSYNCQIRHSGTTATTRALNAILQQFAGAGTVTLGTCYFANVAYAGACTTGVGYDSTVQANNASAVVTSYDHFRVQATGTITAGGAITTTHGLRCNNLGKTGVTTAVGVSIADQASAATSNIGLLMGTTTAPSGSFAIYNQSANDNYIAGDVGIGITAPDTELHVAGTTKTNALRLTAATELTIATGAITVTQSYHRIDTQADAASDDLDTINGGTEGDILVLRAENGARDVVVKDATGNIQCAGDMTLDNVQDTIVLFYDGSNWIELCRSNNSA